MPVETGIDQSIYADEIGIAFSRRDDVVLRSAFQPIYAPEEGQLRVVAVESFLRPFRDGLPITPRPFLEALDEGERRSVERLAMNLHAHNHAHLDIAGLDHVLGISQFASPAWLPEPECHGGSAAVASLRLGGGVGLSRPPDWLAEVGLPVMLGSVGDAAPDPAVIRSARPAIVRLGGAWFRRISESQQATRLLCSLVARLRGDGFKVAVEGIETRRQLGAALDAGADFLQGFLLAHPELAGTVIARPAIELDGIFAGEAPVIPLFGDSRS